MTKALAGEPEFWKFFVVSQQMRMLDRAQNMANHSGVFSVFLSFYCIVGGVFFWGGGASLF